MSNPRNRPSHNVQHKSAPKHLWEALKPLAREMRHSPTPAEEILWRQLRNRQIAGAKFRRQHAIERFIVDFYCHDAALIIEIDGEIHQYTQAEDALRQQYLEGIGLRVLRFSNAAIVYDLEKVLQTIENQLTKPSS